MSCVCHARRLTCSQKAEKSGDGHVERHRRHRRAAAQRGEVRDALVADQVAQER
jgi:hypothetical protein